MSVRVQFKARPDVAAPTVIGTHGYECVRCGRSNTAARSRMVPHATERFAWVFVCSHPDGSVCAGATGDREGASNHE